MRGSKQSAEKWLILIVLSLVLLAGSISPAEAGCVSATLNVCSDCNLPPAWTAFPKTPFPHLRVSTSDFELYQVETSDPLVSTLSPLYAVKGKNPGEVLLLINLSCLRPATFADGFTPLRQLHVMTTGSASGDGSVANPFGMPEHAANVAQPGDIILIHEGRYSGSNYIVNLQGTADHPIAISGVAGEGPAILADAGEPLHLVDPLYVILQDFVVENATGNGINIDDGGDYSTPADFVVIRRLTVRNVGPSGNHDCIKLSGLDDFFVLDNSVRDCSPQDISGSGIDMVGCHRGLIEGNSFRNMGANAIQAKGGSESVVIQGNLMVDAGERAMNLGGSTGLPFFRPLGVDYEARNIQALSNVVIRSWAPVAYVGCDGCLVANNTFYLPEHWVIRILQESVTGFIPCRNGRFINNIVVFNSADVSVFVNIGPDTSPDTFIFSNNLWFSLDDPSFSGPQLPVPETDPVIQRDPEFLDPAALDFHIPADSPAAGAGICINEITKDYDGRCYQDPPSIGAFEPN